MELATAKRSPSGEYAISRTEPLPRRAFAPSGKLNCVWSWAKVLGKYSVETRKSIRKIENTVFFITGSPVQGSKLK
jgi:hypothetical protein